MAVLSNRPVAMFAFRTSEIGAVNAGINLRRSDGLADLEIPGLLDESFE